MKFFYPKLKYSLLSERSHYLRNPSINAGFRRTNKLAKDLNVHLQSITYKTETI